MGACKVKVCRICFVTDCELHLLQENTELYKGYEAVTGLVLADEEDLPSYLCTSCADQLTTCANFKHRSLQAHSMLLGILRKQDHISLESIQAAAKTNHDTDIGNTEEATRFGDFQVQIKCENLPLDSPNFSDEIKIEYDPDNVGADDLVGVEAVPPNVGDNNNMFNVAVNDNEDGTEMTADFKMAASNWNAICNQSNEENVTVVKVDVQHRYSKVTHTVKPNTAISSAPAKQKTLKNTKTKAERMKKERARKKKLNQATSVYSSVHYQNDNLNSLAIALPQDETIWSELDYDMPCVKICVQSTNDCPSVRDLRAGIAITRIPCIKIRIEATSNTSPIVHHQDIILHGDNFNSLRIIALPGQDINVARGKTAAERMREIIAMKKERIKSNSRVVNDAVNSGLGVPSQEIKPRSKTRAEKQEYREMKKRKVESEMVQ